MDVQLDQGVAAIIAGLLGLVGGYLAAHLEFLRRTDELWLKALEFLGGESQKRNLGIAAIELYWRKNRHRALTTPLLVGAAIYLLEESGQGAASHEVFNLQRIFALLLSDDRLVRGRELEYVALRDSLRRALLSERRKGLDIPKVALSAWYEKLESVLPAARRLGAIRQNHAVGIGAPDAG